MTKLTPAFEVKVSTQGIDIVVTVSVMLPEHAEPSSLRDSPSTETPAPAASGAAGSRAISEDEWRWEGNVKRP